MKIFETSKFKKQRKKLKEQSEKEALKEAIIEIAKSPYLSKKLKGELRNLRSFKYFVKGQEQRLIYKYEKGNLYVLSFGPREGIHG